MVTVVKIVIVALGLVLKILEEIQEDYSKESERSEKSCCHLDSGKK